MSYAIEPSDHDGHTRVTEDVNASGTACRSYLPQQRGKDTGEESFKHAEQSRWALDERFNAINVNALPNHEAEERSPGSIAAPVYPLRSGSLWHRHRPKVTPSPTSTHIVDDPVSSRESSPLPSDHGYASSTSVYYETYSRLHEDSAEDAVQGSSIDPPSTPKSNTNTKSWNESSTFRTPLAIPNAGITMVASKPANEGIDNGEFHLLSSRSEETLGPVSRPATTLSFLTPTAFKNETTCHLPIPSAAAADRCFCGNIAEDDSIYCSRACGRSDAMNALCASEQRMIKKAAGLAVSPNGSHYRRVEKQVVARKTKAKIVRDRERKRELLVTRVVGSLGAAEGEKTCDSNKTNEQEHDLRSVAISEGSYRSSSISSSSTRSSTRSQRQLQKLQLPSTSSPSPPVSARSSLARSHFSHAPSLSSSSIATYSTSRTSISGTSVKSCKSLGSLLPVTQQGEVFNRTKASNSDSEQMNDPMSEYDKMKNASDDEDYDDHYEHDDSEDIYAAYQATPTQPPKSTSNRGDKVSASLGSLLAIEDDFARMMTPFSFHQDDDFAFGRTNLISTSSGVSPLWSSSSAAATSAVSMASSSGIYEEERDQVMGGISQQGQELMERVRSKSRRRQPGERSAGPPLSDRSSSGTVGEMKNGGIDERYGHQKGKLSFDDVMGIMMSR